MTSLIEIKNSQPKTLRIQYELSNVCNYKCWYCFPGSNEGTSGWPDVKVVKHNLARVIEYYFLNGIDEIQLVLLGGEPTLWKSLGELVKHIADNTIYDRKKKRLLISIWTNGSRTIRWWNEYGHYFNHVGISVHHELVDLNHVINVADVLLKKRVSVLATVLMDHTVWDKCLGMVNYLLGSKPKFMVLARPVYIDGNTFYNKEQLDYLSSPRKRNPSIQDIFKHIKIYLNRPKYKMIFDNGTTSTTKSDHYFIINKLNKFFSWKCTLGTNLLYIDRAGNLTGNCKAKLFGKDNYFNINDPSMADQFSPVIEPITCKQVECLCASEVVLSKWKTDSKQKVIPIYAN